MRLCRRIPFSHTLPRLDTYVALAEDLLLTGMLLYRDAGLLSASVSTVVDRWSDETVAAGNYVVAWDGEGHLSAVGGNLSRQSRHHNSRHLHVAR
ncbi:hypothetical protein PoB_002574100 [Plakobranchus ocellatus]|uniref:Uncharacterized protein n=1 Tax=Plakobranchus ocellatus TaxID=259542 RepID=A0AAV3ZXF7_9GAST|nr:hypothetical protein PoB_002574100 [Plakobranchus ocellatus]